MGWRSLSRAWSFKSDSCPTESVGTHHRPLSSMSLAAVKMCKQQSRVHTLAEGWLHSLPISCHSKTAPSFGCVHQIGNSLYRLSAHAMGVQDYDYMKRLHTWADDDAYMVTTDSLSDVVRQSIQCVIPESSGGGVNCRFHLLVSADLLWFIAFIHASMLFSSLDLVSTFLTGTMLYVSYAYLHRPGRVTARSAVVNRADLWHITFLPHLMISWDMAQLYCC